MKPIVRYIVLFLIICLVDIAIILVLHWCDVKITTLGAFIIGMIVTPVVMCLCDEFISK